MLDLASMTWETEGKPPTLTYELCNNLCDDIESVPYHKVTWPITVLLPALHDVSLACQCWTCTDHLTACTPAAGVYFWWQEGTNGLPECC